MIVNKFNYIATNDADIKLFNDLLQKTLNSSYFNNKLIHLDQNVIKVLTKYKSGKQSLTIYSLLFIRYDFICSKLYNECDALLEAVMKKLPMLKTSIGYELNVEDKPSGLQESCINSFIYYKWFQNQEGNWISKASDLLIRFCKGHFLINGNKRSAVLLTTSFLHKYCIYLYNSFESNEFIKKWEKLVSEIVDNCEYIYVKKNGKINLEKNSSKVFSKDELFLYVYKYLYDQAYLRLF